MFRLKATLSAVFLAASVALTVAMFVVSVVAPSAQSEENPSEAQYTGEQGGQTDGPSADDPSADDPADGAVTSNGIQPICRFECA